MSVEEGEVTSHNAVLTKLLLFVVLLLVVAGIIWAVLVWVADHNQINNSNNSKSTKPPATTNSPDRVKASNGPNGA